MSDYENMTVAELKELLKEAGLPVSGKKADLVLRLQENDGSSGASEEVEETVEEVEEDSYEDDYEDEDCLK